MKKGNLISLSNGTYMVLEVLYEGNRKYGFLNKIENDNPTEEYYIYEEVEGKVVRITDEATINKLFPEFQKLIISDFEMLKNEMGGEK